MIPHFQGRLRRYLALLPPPPVWKNRGVRTAILGDIHGDYERMLEQAYVFPSLRKAESPAAALDNTLVTQHDRGREITEYIRTVTGKGTTGDAEVMARALESYVVMYANHAAREDTIVFPAWREALADKQLREMGETFEDIRNRQFGKDGFEDAVDQVAAIEKALGIELATLTAPPTPAP